MDLGWIVEIRHAGRAVSPALYSNTHPVDEDELLLYHQPLLGFWWLSGPKLRSHMMSGLFGL